ncbi:hypothetical protein G9A89_016068 [Geosiphon pyriformis]|nr:hypothetical protein G9A89_016068 [Geosiphon pyriformis]
MEPSFNISVKSAESRKKRRGSVLENDIGNRKFTATRVSSSCSWGSETGDTTESDSVDMEEECLVEETSFDHRNGSAFAKEDLEQMSKSLKILTKRAFGKSLGKIDFLGDDFNNILLDKPVVLPPPLKNLVNISVRKSFALDISLDNIVGKSAQKKLVVVRKLFSKINGFGEASTPSKFAGVVKTMFTSELSLVQASKKAEEIKILVNPNLKKSSGCSDRAVILKEIPVKTSPEAVCTALSDFGVVVLIKMQLTDLVVACWSILIGKDAVHVVRADHDKKLALLYTLSMGTTAHDIWDYISSVGGKPYAIDCYPVMYAQVRCVVVCFELADFLNAVMRTTPVLRGVNMHWSLLGFSKCAECEKLGHTSLGCIVNGNPSSGKHSRKSLSDIDKSRLATIYAKHSAPIACFVAFGGVFWAKIAGGNGFSLLLMHEVLVISGSSSEIKPTILDTSNIEKRFAVLESSLASLVEQIGELAKRLDSFMLADQIGDVVMRKGLDKATSGETAMTLDSSAFSEVKRLENMLEGLSASVLSLTASLVWKIATCNVRSMNNSAKQDDVIHWYKEINNLISIVTETKLRGKIHLWIINKFDSVQVFTSGLDFGHLGFGIAIIIDNSLNNLSVLILGLYAGALSVVWFSQVGEINSLIAKAVNESSFVILGGDFNEDGTRKCASFKKCFDLGLVDSLYGSLFFKTLTWSNSCGVIRAFDYILISSSLVNAVIDGSVANVEDYFDKDHKTVSASVGLSGLLDVYLSSICKQTNKDHWKFDIKSVDEVKWNEFKDATVANAAMFLDKFETAKKFFDLDAIYDGVFTKEFSKLHKLKILVLKIVKTSHEADSGRFESLLRCWVFLNSDKAFAVWDLMSSDASLFCSLWCEEVLSHFQACRVFEN